ncbi:MAG: hypothetical protein AAGU77_10035 [Bacillota bacterium]
MADRAKRISGQYMDSAMGGEYAQLRDGKWHLDLAAVRACVDAYLKEAEGAGRYSISGLCIKLGVTREALRLWRMGYVSAADEQRARVLPNAELADIIAWAELHVHRYWEECDESKLQSKHTKLLESAGVVGERKPSAPQAVRYDLGSYKKYAR